MEKIESNQKEEEQNHNYSIFIGYHAELDAKDESEAIHLVKAGIKSGNIKCSQIICRNHDGLSSIDLGEEAFKRPLE